MAFTFGFNGDDIAEDPGDNEATSPRIPPTPQAVPLPIAPRSHSLKEMLQCLPDRISYSTMQITSPKGLTTCLARRELFDVRLQLMAEDDGTCAAPLTGLDNLDLKTNVYEGGYKTWECSLDLVRYLLDRGPRKDLDDLVRVHHIIEMGCGSALPSLLLFQYALQNGLGIYFTLMDYNEDVLRLITVPNLLLAWTMTLDHTQSNSLFPDTGNPLLTSETSGDLSITPSLLVAFIDALGAAGISLTLISGAWTPTTTLLQLIPSTPELNTFILGSETIYSPDSLLAFTEAMTELMKRVKSGKAIVAAKRVYFGVGGSIDEFREECARRGCVGYELEFEGLEAGVRRCLVEVQMY